MSGDPEQEYFADGMVEGNHHRAFPYPMALCNRPQFELNLQRAGRRREVGEDQPAASRPECVSERRLMDCLTKLGRDVQIVVKVAPSFPGKRPTVDCLLLDSG